MNKNRSNKDIKTIKLAGATNILFGICTTLIFLLTVLNNMKFAGKQLLDMNGLMTNETFKNMYMTFQLCTVVTGVVSAIYGFKLIRIKNSLIFQVAYFLAGINCMLLMFMGVVLIIAPLNIVAGKKMFDLLKEEPENIDDEFGGRSSALEEKNVSTATVLDAMRVVSGDTNTEEEILANEEAAIDEENEENEENEETEETDNEE